MGCNCFKASTSDDISLLRGGQEPSHDLMIDSSSGGYSDHPPPHPPPYEQHERRLGLLSQQQVFQLSEDDQVKIAKRIGLINHLPCGIYDSNKKARECAICMGEFVIGDKVRFLPCMHTYHCECIDDWLMRSLTCPSCMEPVDAALFTTYDINCY